MSRHTQGSVPAVGREPSTLVAQVAAAVLRHAEQPALVQGDVTRSYADLWRAASRVAATIAARASDTDEAPFVAVVGARSLEAYEQLLGIVLAGRGYMPLEPELPPRRLAALLAQARVTTILADRESLPLLSEVCALSEHSLQIICPDASHEDLSAIAALGRHAVVGSDGIADGAGWSPAAAEDDPLYLIFTSGSTGLPKGVVVEHRSITALISGLRAELEIGPDDVVAQLFKLAFDPSVMVAFLAWTSGATLVVPDREAGVLSDATLINRHGVTVWASVPSRTAIMRRVRQLRPGAYPGLRLVIQGGEALSTDDCEAWTAAAPGARVVNQYGPTETAVCVTQYVWDPQASPAECIGTRVPIGHPLPGVEVVVVDDRLVEVADGESGELLVGGAQVARGYWGDSDRTAAAFVSLPGRSGRYYRTGDLVHRSVPGGPLHFSGRADGQVKVLGRRIELGEVEAVVRSVLGVSQAAALGWPVTAGGFDGIEVFVAGDVADTARDDLANRLPPEVVPRRIHSLPQLPLTLNGKVDRRALQAVLHGAG